MKGNTLIASIKGIISKIKLRGDKALIFYSKKFDNYTLFPKKIRVSKSEIQNSSKKVDNLLKKALEKAAENIKNFHLAELNNLNLYWKIKNGKIFVGQLCSAIERIGIYVPGGRFSYPSTVLMTAIPAKVAGVKKIAMVTPPNKLTPAVLYAAKLAGVDEIYRVGGPQAIAALAYGTKTIAPVDLIIGPGNAYVNEAKRQVFGKVGIDSLAGPSEVAIIADKGADVSYIVADLMAQSEHDPDAKAFLYTDSKKIFSQVKNLIPKGLKGQIKFILCPIPKALNLVNSLAPEHLELMIKGADKLINKIKNAGAIFSGYKTPTALGDYWAGPSHVLPTGRTSRFSSGLSVQTFIKRTSYVSFQEGSLKEDGVYIQKLAETEGLKSHRESVKLRNGGK
ncbi:MAG: histidinol dehydrogenase [Elusimicrobia bacterium]|nr:histidinol dehydrogenase [Elusimicrobiota bacterium]